MSDEEIAVPLYTDLAAKHYVDKAKTDPYMKPVTDQSLNEASVIAERARDAMVAETPVAREEPQWSWTDAPTETA